MKRNLLLLSLSLSSMGMWAQSVNGVELTTNPNNTAFLKANVQLTNGETVTFAGFDDVYADEMLQPDFFEIETGTTAVFTGITGEYTLEYNTADKVMFVVKEGAKYPEVLWLIGQGFGHPKAGKANPAWKLDLPDAMQAKKIDDDVYQMTMYLAADLDFVSKAEPNWDQNYVLCGNKMEPLPSNEVETVYFVNENGNSHLCGDYKATANFQAGVYTVRFDLKNKKCVFLKEGENPDDFTYERKINGVAGISTQLTGHDKTIDYEYWDLDLTQNQSMTFTDFGRLELMVQPEFFTNYDGTWKFNAPTGRYRIWFITEDKALFCEPLGDPVVDENGEGVALITGEKFIHPAKNGVFCDNLRAAWGFDLPTDYVYCVPKGNGVHETYLYIEPGFYFGVFNKNVWEYKTSGPDYTVTGDIAGLRSPENKNPNFCIDESRHGEFTSQAYHVTVDMKNKTINFAKVNMSEVNGVHTSIPLGVEKVAEAEKTVTGVYSITGVKIIDTDNLAKGIYVIVYSDGTSKKVIK